MGSAGFGLDFGALASQHGGRMVLSQIHRGTGTSRRGTDAKMVGYTLRFHFLRNLVLRPSLVLAGRDEKALVEDVHQVEFGALQLDPLAFQLIT